LAEREKKGFFLFADGTKSTDPENKSRVAKEEKPKDGKPNKSRLHKEEDGDDEETKEEKVLPPRAKSAYNYFS
jgi:hypothetical protein